ncbi:MAG TPA: hypothetical protein VGF20_11005 [Candidatus Acidoferrum sp.]|jgi:hypothetical protein
MCPECFAAIALAVTGAISAGGVTAASIKFFRSLKASAKISNAFQIRLRKEKEK